MDQLFADRDNDVTYITVFQGHFKWHHNKHLHKLLLNFVRINALHVDAYRIELFYKAAITYIHVILLQILAVMDIMH